MTSSSPPATSITATDLAERLAHGAPLTVLDVRDDAAWGIEAPGVTSRHLPATAVSPTRTAAPAPRGPRRRGLQPRRHGPAASRRRSAPRASTRCSSKAACAAGSARLQRTTVDLGVAGPRRAPGPAPRTRLPVLRDRRRAARRSSSTPRPDADFYVALAAELGATVTDVVDTHLHADHLSGARALAAQTGARCAFRRPRSSAASPTRHAAARRRRRSASAASTVRALALPGHTTDMTGL